MIDGDQTRNLRGHIPALYQLSYDHSDAWRTCTSELFRGLLYRQSASLLAQRIERIHLVIPRCCAA